MTGSCWLLGAAKDYIFLSLHWDRLSRFLDLPTDLVHGGEEAVHRLHRTGEIVLESDQAGLHFTERSDGGVADALRRLGVPRGL